MDAGFGAAVVRAWEGVHVEGGPFRALWTGWKWRRLGGDGGFVVQFNPQHWAKKRGGRHVPEHSPVLKPFSDEGFHFNKIGDEREVLMCCAHTGKAGDTFEWGEGEHMLAINVSPMFRAHSLLVPQPLQRHPQQITRCGAAIALAAASAVRKGDDSFRVGYNSLGAFASVNHLHFHLIATSPTTGQSGFPLESAALESVGGGGGGFEVMRTASWPVRTAVIRGEEAGVAEGLFAICDMLQEEGVPFNAILRGAGGEEAVAWVTPRKNQSNNGGDFRAAVVEIGGVVTAISEEHMSHVVEGDITKELVSDVTLEEADFTALLHRFCHRIA
eukprot:Hpha_TRINITY_DN16740_c1_g4::TRINITY_DN16740_c1_g4_i1::g.79887::m.79887